MRVGAHRIDDVRARRDIAAERAERLRERAFQYVDAMHLPLARANAAAARPVHADRVHLVAIGHRAVFFRQIADRLHRRDVAVHRIEAFEDDQLRPFAWFSRQQLLEMLHVVVPPDRLLGAALAHALDHGIVVPFVGQDQAMRQQLGDRGDAGLVRNVAGGKDQRGFLAVQVGEFRLELHQRVIGPGDIARAAGSRAHARRGLDHGANDFRVLPHAEIVVRAPDHDVALALRRMPIGMRKPAGDAFQVGKYAIAPLGPQASQRVCKKPLVIHGLAVSLSV